MFNTLQNGNIAGQKASRLQIVATLLLVCALLAIAWAMSSWEGTSLERFVQLGHNLKLQQLTILKVVGAYILGGLIFIPITLLVCATVIVFGPLLGFTYALLGAVLSSIITFGLGILLKRKARLNFEFNTLKRLNMLLKKQGIVSMFLARNLILVPFSLLNILAGATQISFRDYLLGTILGLLPYFLAIAVFTDSLIAAIVNPNWLNVLLALLFTLLFLFACNYLKNRYKDKEISPLS